MADQVNIQVIIEKDLGDSGTWRDALYLPLDEYTQMKADNTFDDWYLSTKEERYANYLKAVTPDPVKVLQDHASSIVDQIVALAQEHVGVHQQIKDLDPDAHVPGIPEELVTQVTVDDPSLIGNALTPKEG